MGYLWLGFPAPGVEQTGCIFPYHLVRNRTEIQVPSAQLLAISSASSATRNRAIILTRLWEGRVEEEKLDIKDSHEWVTGEERSE